MAAVLRAYARQSEFNQESSINQKRKAMKEYYLEDANFSIEDSEIYRANLLASIYLLMSQEG